MLQNVLCLGVIVSGMALKLYAATPAQDEYQRAGFGVVLVFVSVVCVLLGLCSIIASTPCLRDSVMRRLNGIAKRSGKANVATKKKAKKVAVVVDKSVEMVQRKEI